MSSITLERNKLYEEIWEEPISVVCKRYSLSDNGLRKICIKLEIPIPDRSYWGKLRAGKKAEKRNLPKYDGSNEYTVHIDEWALKRREQRKEDALRGFSEEEKEKILDICNNMKVRTSTSNLHPLVEARKKSSRDDNRFYGAKPLDEKKRTITKNRKYLIYHAVITTIEKLGYRVKEDYSNFTAVIFGEEVKFRIIAKTKVVREDDVYGTRTYEETGDGV